MELKRYKMFEVEEDLGGEIFDCLLIAPNVEKRSSYLYKRFGLSSFESVYVFDFDNFHQPEYFKYEAAIFDGVDTTDFIIFKGNENQIIQQFVKCDLKNKQKIAIDITGFSIPQLLQIMKIIIARCSQSIVDFFYTEPMHYMYKEGYLDQYHPESVQRICAPIRGYYNSGIKQAESLVILLGFENGLANLVYSRIAEDSQDNGATYAINGLPSFSIKMKDISILNNFDFLLHIDDDDIFTASANNPFSVFNTLIDIFDKDTEMPLNICPLGSKPMALGAGLFALYINSHFTQKPIKVIYPSYIKKKFEIEELPGKVWRYEISASDIIQIDNIKVV